MKIVVYKRVTSEQKSSDCQCPKSVFDECYLDYGAPHKGSQLKPELEKCLRALKEGDQLHVESLNKLGQTLGDLSTIIKRIVNSGASLHLAIDNLTFIENKSQGNLSNLCKILDIVISFEQLVVKERQAEGIARARARGAYKGRANRYTMPERENIVREANTNSLLGPRAKKKEVCAKYKISKNTLWRYEKEIRAKLSQTSSSHLRLE